MKPEDESERARLRAPLHIISLGAGVQSSTMALMAAAGEITPMPDYAIFADTIAEPKAVYEWLDWLERHLPFPIIRVCKGSLAEAALKVRISKNGNSYTNSNVPAFLKTAGVEREGLQMRQCTRDFKIDVLLREVRMIAKQKLPAWKKSHAVALNTWRAHMRAVAFAKKQKRVYLAPFPQSDWQELQSSAPVVQWIGISRDEWTRAKESRVPYIFHRWPLVEMKMTRKACLAWMDALGFPVPPRSACVFCPYHGDAEWHRLKTEEPEEFERAAQFEDAYQHTLSQIQRRSAVPFLHRSCRPIRSIDFAKAIADKANIEAQQPDFFGSECEGMCGV